MRLLAERVFDTLTRGRLVALGVLLVTLAGIAVVVGVFASGWWQDEGGSYAPRALIAASRITPQSSLFADPLTAEIDVTVDPRRIDPASIELAPRFAPFVVRSQSRSVGRRVGAAAAVRFRYEIQCVSYACIPLMTQGAKTSAQAKAVSLRPATLSARRSDGTALAESVAWPPFTVHSRLTAEEIGLSTPHIAPWFTPPPVTWRLSPDLLGALTVSAAILLLLAAGWLVASVAAGDARRLRIWKIPSHLTPVERALRLAEHAAAGAELDEERKALQRLAVELRRKGHGELADRARRLAWAEGDPAPALTALAREVRSNGAR